MKKTRPVILALLFLLGALLTLNGQKALAQCTVQSGGTYPTIAMAVAAAQSGDVIECAAGNYAAGANINKSITLKGAQAGVDARDGRPGASESVITAGGVMHPPAEPGAFCCEPLEAAMRGR